VRAPRDLAAGVSLAVTGLVALWAGAGLDAGTLRSLGPGMLPRATGWLVLGAGIALAVASLVKRGEPVGRLPLRGPVFLILALVAFALTIRSPGLAVAGPLVVLIGGAGSPEARPRELAVLAVVLTLFCVGLFRLALGLPIPVLSIPGVITL
jgi:putative tricarboxylic transport membrane protein